MTGLRFLLRVTLRRLDFAEEVYHLRERRGFRSSLPASENLHNCGLVQCSKAALRSNELPQDRVRLSHTADAKLLLIR